MKKIILLLSIILSSAGVFACAICGCSSGNYFIGPFPQFKKHFIGMRYSFRSFDTKLTADATQYSKDFYQTAEIWGGLNIGHKWQIIGFLPYSFNHQNSDDGNIRDNGLGDLTVLANYKIASLTTRHNIIHTLWLGGGVKAPTGRYSLDPDDIVPSANRQPGTGSLDYLANAMYSLQYARWGVSANVNYKFNQSADTFRFGNKLSASGFLFHQYLIGSTTFNPTVGLFYEKLAANRQADVKVADTGGTALLGAAGLETNFRIITIGFNVQLPIAQDFSNGQTVTKVRGMIHATYTF